MTIREMKEAMREWGLSDQELSRRSGIPFDMVQNILSGREETLDLDALLLLKQTIIGWRQGGEDSLHPNTLREHPFPYSTESNEKKTLSDYYNLPEERRVELINGVFYDMAAPTKTHQRILVQLLIQFEACAEAHGDDCEVYVAPCDVQLDRDQYTMLQPDLLVVCGNDDRLDDDRCIYGAPDLTLEILSPATRSKDMLLKLNKYKDAGVQEYWIVDPEQEKILVYDFSKPGTEPETYTFDSRIPVHISQGTCEIDFAKIHQKLLQRR